MTSVVRYQQASLLNCMCLPLVLMMWKRCWEFIFAQPNPMYFNFLINKFKIMKLKVHIIQIDQELFLN